MSASAPSGGARVGRHPDALTKITPTGMGRLRGAYEHAIHQIEGDHRRPWTLPTLEVCHQFVAVVFGRSSISAERTDKIDIDIAIELSAGPKPSQRAGQESRTRTGSRSATRMNRGTGPRGTNVLILHPRG
ncbi:hypothetical protein EVAR_7281_1 [Eumeta japonica]|uniref:Uncharacterized protein n=1 Tax=Eumeta variegata TaxID=151549 RepID=A0A4C1T3H3_EUMVA|nr:hypothetical protein EVAR_7281_1 [Eumeta japonica]